MSNNTLEHLKPILHNRTSEQDTKSTEISPKVAEFLNFKLVCRGKLAMFLIWNKTTTKQSRPY